MSMIDCSQRRDDTSLQIRLRRGHIRCFRLQNLPECFDYESEVIDHFTVVCLVAWPLNESEAGGDLVLIETSLLFSC